jgi:hypothetical protein
MGDVPDNLRLEICFNPDMLCGVIQHLFLLFTHFVSEGACPVRL